MKIIFLTYFFANLIDFVYIDFNSKDQSKKADEKKTEQKEKNDDSEHPEKDMIRKIREVEKIIKERNGGKQ